MTDLRETLAARFVNIFSPRITDALPWEQLANWQKDKWYELADECIRQMEWVRHECCKGSSFGTSADDHTFFNASCPLTPAPDDWSPKEPDK